MQLWQYLLLFGLGAAALALALLSGIRKGRERRLRDFTRRLETLLLPKETIKLIFSHRKGRWVVTSRRLILEVGDGFTAVPLEKIQKLSGADAEGKATASAAKMESLTVKFNDRELTLRRSGEAFTDLAKALKEGVSAAKKKKK